MNVMSIWSQSRSSECKLPVVRTGRPPVAEQRAQRTVWRVLALVSTLALGFPLPRQLSTSIRNDHRCAGSAVGPGEPSIA